MVSTIQRMPTVILVASRRCSMDGESRRASRCHCIRPSRQTSNFISHRVSAAVLSELVPARDVRTVSSRCRRFEPQTTLSHRPRARRRVGVGSVHGRACIASSLRTELFMMLGRRPMPNKSLQATPMDRERARDGVAARPENFRGSASRFTLVGPAWLSSGR